MGFYQSLASCSGRDNLGRSGKEYSVVWKRRRKGKLRTGPGTQNHTGSWNGAVSYLIQKKNWLILNTNLTLVWKTANENCTRKVHSCTFKFSIYNFFDKFTYIRNVMDLQQKIYTYTITSLYKIYYIYIHSCVYTYGFYVVELFSKKGSVYIYIYIFIFINYYMMNNCGLYIVTLRSVGRLARRNPLNAPTWL